MIIYRADNRHPSVIKKDGFAPRNKEHHKLPTVRKFLLSYCGTNQLQPLDLARFIISSPQPEFVSTAVSQDCGGYESKFNYIYEIEVADLVTLKFSGAVLGLSAEDAKKLKVNALSPKLLMDAHKLEDAKVIALLLHGHAEEITFMTPIPASIRCKANGEMIFKSLDSFGNP
jgi:hypothetical protein